ncbi:MAG: glycosyl hydrolase 108 family protein [Thermoplasmataceae archaeon]
MNLHTALHPNLDILEGRFTVDNGGPTESGITQSAWDAYCDSKGEVRSPVSSLSPEDELAFYGEGYWNPLMCDKLEALQEGLGFVLFQWALNHEGAGNHGGAVMSLQVCCGIPPDGVMGPTTLLVASQVYDKKKLMACILGRQEGWYKDEAAKCADAPLLGWEGRIKKVRGIVGLTQVSV